MSEDYYRPFLKVVMNVDSIMGEANHSGILSPIGNLDPDAIFNIPYGKRRAALLSLIRQMEYPISQRAIRWIALYDTEPTLREVARRALGYVPEWDGNTDIPLIVERHLQIQGNRDTFYWSSFSKLYFLSEYR